MRNAHLKFLFFLILFISGISFAKSPPPGAGAGNIPANILLSLDTSGSMNATVTAGKRVTSPADVGFDSSGNMYVVDRLNHRIMKFSSDGIYLGSGGSLRNPFFYPWSIAIDADDNIYVANYRYKNIIKMNTNLDVVGKFGTRWFPVSVATDEDGNIYVSEFDYDDTRLAKYSPEGKRLNLTTTRNYCDEHPVRISYYNGYVYAYHACKGIITRYTSNLTGYKRLTRSSNLRGDQWSGIHVNANGIYVNGGRGYQFIKRTDHNGNLFGSTASIRTRGMWDMASDANGNIYVADYRENRIVVFNKSLAHIKDIVRSPSITRLDMAKELIKNMVSDSELNNGANFGLLRWSGHYYDPNIKAPEILVPISDTGAQEIFNTIDNLTVGDYDRTLITAGMRLARDYFNGRTSHPSPIDPKRPCQKNMIIVISDGGFYAPKSWSAPISESNTIAEGLYQNQSIPTLVTGIYSGFQQSHVNLATAGGTYPDPGVTYADNIDQTLAVISDYIRQTIASRMTFTSPIIMPGIKNDDELYQSTFEYNNTHQWKGELTKFYLKSDGTLGDKVWEAGKRLNTKNQASRNIWTVGPEHSLNNFTTSNVEVLKPLMWSGNSVMPSDADAEKLINFVRGIDSYDEDSDGSVTDERWKLGDIYHSKLVVVGPPNLNTSNDANDITTEAYYRYQKNYDSFKNSGSCGGSCANRKNVVYVGANDGMLHAFDANTGDELWAFIPPAMLDKLRGMISQNANSSASIYGVDGSPVVKDIFYNNKWRTVLLAGMGRGGNSYFALDVTNPNAPTFLFAFENDVFNSSIYHWDINSGNNEYNPASPVAEFDYSKLGEAWSTPMIMPIPQGNDYKWVAVFGAGYNSGINSNYGSAIYVIDLEDQGKVIKKIDLRDIPNNNIANSVPADVVGLSSDSTNIAKYKGRMVYVSDLEGKIWKLNLTNTDTLYAYSELFNSEATFDNDRMSFHQITPSIGTDGKLWLYFGTGNYEKLQRVSGAIQNRIFGFRDSNFPKFKSVSSGSVAKMRNNSLSGGICPTTSDLGWYVNLNTNEKVAGKLAVSNSTVFSTRYTPNTNNQCSAGDSKLTEHDFMCGNTLRNVNLGGGVATSPTIFKDKVYIGISGSGDQLISDSAGNTVGTKDDNLLIINQRPKSSAGGNFKYESWREVF